MCYILTIKVGSFHCPFCPHLSYLHDFGALGPFAGARPAQHEHNLRIHHQRHPVQKARHPLRHVTEQTGDHKPAETHVNLGVEWREGVGEKLQAELTGECVSVFVGRKSTSHNDTTSAVDFSYQWGFHMGVTQV